MWPKLGILSSEGLSKTQAIVLPETPRLFKPEETEGKSTLQSRGTWRKGDTRAVSCR